MTTIELDMTARASALFARIGRRRGALWLDDATSVEPPFMGLHPEAQLFVRPDGSVFTVERGGRRHVASDPLHAVAAFLDETPDTGLPWTVGYLGYDLAPFVEPAMRPRTGGDGALPLAYLARYDALLAGEPAGSDADALDPPLRWRVHARDDAAAARLATAVDAGSRHEGWAASPRGTLLEVPDRRRHESAVGRALHHIAAGEVYQVNLAGRFRVASTLAPHEAYLRLRTLQPVRHGMFLDAGDFAVLGNSPERFLRVEDGVVETCPIKGTRRRGRSPDEDRRLISDLLADPKERAEHVMIVDLERSDLGRISRAGSIEVPRFLEIETYATLHHLVSTVRGRIREDVGWDALLRATFPGGSITGAPKIRAMQVIAELEEHPRELYTGALVACRGPRRLDSAIAIRVAVARAGVYTYHAGGGIVADSDPTREYEECLLKAEPFLGATLGARSHDIEHAHGGDAWPEAR
jgi:anthranilate/para-aminobenzoate synthase component I